MCESLGPEHEARREISQLDTAREMLSNFLEPLVTSVRDELLKWQVLDISVGFLQDASVANAQLPEVGKQLRLEWIATHS